MYNVPCFSGLGQNFGFKPIQLHSNAAVGGLDYGGLFLCAVIDDDQLVSLQILMHNRRFSIQCLIIQQQSQHGKPIGYDLTPIRCFADILYLNDFF